jgi:hypothetical protein
MIKQSTLIHLFLAFSLSTGAMADGSFPLANGTINATSHKSAEISLNSLRGQAEAYNIVCFLNDPTGVTLPAKILLATNIDADPMKPSSLPILFWDGAQLDSQGTATVIIKDANQHKLTFKLSTFNLGESAQINFTWLSGNDWVTPISYACTAEAVAKKQ